MIGRRTPVRDAAEVWMGLTRDADSEQDELTRAELQQFREVLQRKRAEVVESIQLHGRDRSLQIDNTEVGDDGDQAVMEVEAAYRLRKIDKDRDLLREIDQALRRIESGTFGTCEGTGEPIERPRLDKFPWVRFSRAHQEQVEGPFRRRASDDS